MSLEGATSITSTATLPTIAVQAASTEHLDQQQELEEEGGTALELEDPIDEEEDEDETQPMYGIDDVPPHITGILASTEHFLIAATHNICLSLLVSRILFTDDGLMHGYLISMAFILAGCSTLAQATFGSRLPIYQGGQLAIVLPLAGLAAIRQDASSDNNLYANNTNTQQDCSPVVSEIHSSIVIAAIVQQLLGFTGVMSILLALITPLVIVPTTALIGLSLYEMVAVMAATHWPIALCTVSLNVILILYIGELSIPCWSSQDSRMERITIKLTPHFCVCVVLLLMWALCSMLTAAGFLEDMTFARAAANTSSFMHEAPWFTVPHQAFCLTSPSAAGVVGMLIAVLASSVESFTNYFDAARMLSLTYPPAHTMNRGVGLEGLGTMFSGLLGVPFISTSLSQINQTMVINKVGSRRVAIYCAVIMLVLGVSGKFGALFLSIPEPVVAGVLMVLCAYITAHGITTIQFCDLNSSRNLFVMGFPLYFSLAIAKWLRNHPDALDVGNNSANECLHVLLQTPVAVGLILGLFLDHTIPGTYRERGIYGWKSRHNVPWARNVFSFWQEDQEDEHLKSYDLPGLPTDRMKLFQKIPFCPGFNGFSFHEE